MTLGNNPPGEVERRILQSIVQQEKRILSRIQSEIQKVEATIAAHEAAYKEAELVFTRATTECARIEASLNEKAQVLNLIRYFPRGILAHIFEYCLFESPTYPTKSRSLVLSQICRSWREAALSTPKLWSRLSIDFEAWSTPLVEKACHWVKHSRGCLEHIHLRLPNPNGNMFHSYVMETIMPTAPSWRSVIMEGSFDGKILDYLQFPMPNLTSISISSLAWMESNHTPRVPEWFLQDAPQLTSIEVKGFAWLNTPKQFEALRELKLLWVDDELDLVGTFSQLPSLTALECYGPFKINPAEFLPPSHFRSLKHLSINEGSYRGFKRPEMALAFPALESLWFINIRFWGDVDFICSFMWRLPNPSLLQSLTLTGFGHNDEERDQHLLESTIRGLANAIGLRQLRIQHSWLYDRLLVVLSTCNWFGESVEGWLCPQLTHIEIYWCPNISGLALLNFVRTRRSSALIGGRGSTRALESVLVTNCEKVQPWQIDQVNSLIRDSVVFD